MKYFSAFTGVGGFDLGMTNWECVGFSEIDKYANEVLRYRFPKVKNYGDIRQIEWKDVPDIEMLVGGTPCQDLSVAGKHEGLEGSQSRLFFEFIRALKEKKPQYFIWENVKGALYSNKGWDFARVLLEFSDAGYALWWQVLDASWFGIPQHRERVFVVGSLGKEPPLKVFFDPDSNKKNTRLQGQTTNTIRRRYFGAQAVGTYVVESQFNAQKIKYAHFNRQQYKRIYETNGIAPTLHRYTGGSQNVKIAIPVLTPDRMEKRQNGRRFKQNGEPAYTLTRQDRQGIFDGKIIRALTPRECERLMGWEDNWTRYGIDETGHIVELSDTQRYNLIGNGVVPQVVSAIIKHGKWN